MEDSLHKPVLTHMSTLLEWRGTATDFFNEIQAESRPRAASHRLRLLAPTLKTAGITVVFHRRHAGTREITITNEIWRHPAPPQPPNPTINNHCPTHPLAN